MCRSRVREIQGINWSIWPHNSLSARRNTVFQGAAADGAKLALYGLWRAGFTVVAFIHDEVVLEVDADADLAAVKEKVDGILVSSMKEICPDILIEVEGSFRRRWGNDKAGVIPLPVCEEGETGEHPEYGLSGLDLGVKEHAVLDLKGKKSGQPTTEREKEPVPAVLERVVCKVASSNG